MKLLTQLITVSIITGLALISYSCDSKAQADFDPKGIYYVHTDDPLKKRFIQNEKIFLKIDDETVTYNTTINGKPKFHFVGKYSLDADSNMLNIDWKDGKLPKQLKVEKKGDDYHILVGQTLYIKGPHH